MVPTASLTLTLLVALATAMPTNLNNKRSEILADEYLIGSGYKRDVPSKKANADAYDLRSAWSKKDVAGNADAYDLRSAWSKKDVIEDANAKKDVVGTADAYDLRSAWSKRNEALAN